MAAQKKETFNNLIDICINFENDPGFSGNANEMFRNLLRDYFFREEYNAAKKIEFFLNDLEMPSVLENIQSLYTVNPEDLITYIEGDVINNSLSGRIMLSKQYLQIFYSNHPASFSQLPEDVKYDLLDDIKQKNNRIYSAFEKMSQDRIADRNRRILGLIALILKNIYRKTGKLLSKLELPVEEIIKSIYDNSSEIFTGSQLQMSDIGDDTKIKKLVKTIFIVKQFSEISDLSDIFREELERYRKRGIRAAAE